MDRPTGASNVPVGGGEPLMRLTVLTIVTCLSLLATLGCGSGQEPPPPAPAPEGGARTAPLPSGGESGELPEGHPPLEGATQGELLPPPPGTGSGATGLTWTVPDGWVEVQPSSSVRRAQYRVPGSAGDGEMVVFYFGPGQGGDPMANATRWANQFSQPDGSSSLDQLKTSEQTVAGLSVLRVELDGRYQNPFTSDPPIDEATLLAAIVSGPDANWFFKLTGPSATVESNRTAFESLVGSLSTGS